eukprot:2720615-Prymnesium_polylepis.1
MAGPWSAGRLVGLLNDLRATSRSHSSLFTLHSSLFAFRKGQGPTCDWPGGLAGRRPHSVQPPKNLATRRSHVTHFTLHSLLFTGGLLACGEPEVHALHRQP